MTASDQLPTVFGALHLAILGLTVLLSLITLWGARRLRGSAWETVATRTAGWVLLMVSLVWMVWNMLPANWHIDHSLPLHFSDALRFIAAIALIRRSRWAVAISYYWGLTLNPQALVTPHPSQLSAAGVDFVLYWGLHIAVLLVPIALIWGLGHRPQWKDFVIAYGAALFWAAIVFLVNAAIGTNYAFLNRHPEGPSLLDLLGQWPMYLLWLVTITGIVWALMTWPWTRRTSRPDTESAHQKLTAQ